MKIAVYILFGIIVLFSLYQIFVVDRRSFSINKFIWFYVLLFWGVAPLVQFSVGIYSWDITVSDATALKSNILILIFMISYRMAYKKVLREDVIDQDNYQLSGFSISSPGIVILISLQVLIFVLILIMNKGLLLLRGETADLEAPNSQAMQLIIDQVTRAFTTFVTFLFFWHYKQGKSTKSLLILILSFTILLFTNFPLAIPRYMAGAFYIGLLFIAKPIYKKKSLPVYALIFVFLVLYPLMSLVRYLTSLADMEVNTSLLLALTSADFDNYSTLNMAVLHVGNHGITFGHQLLGVLLFFVPRSLWFAKPLGSGAFMAESRFMDFTNISCPFVAEGYINFGFLGVVLFAVLIGIAASKLDFSFYHHKKLSVIHLFYPATLGLIIFILRGDLMSSWAYTVSFVIAALLLYQLIKPHVVYQDEPDLIASESE